MSESDQDLEEADQLFVCPYNSTHRLTIAQMGLHLMKCRENASITEKAICPFNDKHAILAPEMDYHKLICLDKPTENETRHVNGSKLEAEEATPTKRLFGSFSSETTFSFSSCETETTATGCESGLHLVGGIRNCDSFIDGTNENGANTFHSDSELASNEEKQQPLNGINGGCCTLRSEDESVLIEELKSPSRNLSTEKQLEQSKSDSLSCEGSNSRSMGSDERLSEEERFDYTKYIPSKDLREDFLKLIGQPRNGQVHDTKHHVSAQPYAIQQWPPGYNFLPAQYHTHNGFQSPTVQPAFISFSNAYNMIPVVPAQAPYTASYGFHNQPPGPGGFLQTSGQYDMNGYPAARPSYHRPFFKRRNHYNSYSLRYNNHKNYSTHNLENHTQVPLNGFSQSEANLAENSCYLNKLNGTENHNNTSKSHPTSLKNGCDYPTQPLLSPKFSHSSLEMEDTDSQQQFVDISEVTAKLPFGGGKTNGEENYCTLIQRDIRKSESDKQIRKIKKKLAEINGLEEKCRQGANLDCDQLKKLSRKSEFEDQLQLLNLS